METTNECPICVEQYNKTTRAPITCVKCDFVCCKVCFKRFITDTEGANLLSCMSCHVQFDRTSLHTRLGQTFMRTAYRDIRENLLYEEEKSFFPATLEIIERELEITRLRTDRDQLDTKYDNIRRQRIVPLKELRYSKEVMQVGKAIDLYLILKNNVEIVDEQLRDERQTLTAKIHEMEQTKNGAPKPKTYVLACTKEDCRGMLSIENKNTKGNYVCMICTSQTCDQCRMEVTSDDHECDPDVLKTVEYMNSTSKPCPQCGIPIFKISGCNQMFCTSCHVSFDWTTLRINNGAVHNPHHAQWLRDTRNRPREVNDVACAREPTMDMALDVAAAMEDAIMICEDKALKASGTALLDYVFEMVRTSIHHHNVTIRALAREQNRHRVNLHLRVQYLKGDMSEAIFKKRIQTNDKAASKRNELLHVAMLYRDALADILSPFLDRGAHPVPRWIELAKEIQGLEKYCNDCFEAIAVTYGSRQYEIAGDNSHIRA